MIKFEQQILSFTKYERMMFVQGRKVMDYCVIYHIVYDIHFEQALLQISIEFSEFIE